MATGQARIIGIIGTGEIGWRMGKLLRAAGYDVIGYDVRSEALQQARNSGFMLAGSIGELCRHADLVITCVTDGAALRRVVTGADGLAGNMRSGTPLIDTTSA